MLCQIAETTEKLLQPPRRRTPRHAIDTIDADTRRIQLVVDVLTFVFDSTVVEQSRLKAGHRSGEAVRTTVREDHNVIGGDGETQLPAAWQGAIRSPYQV
jgi:hypothetical protein